MSKKEELQKLFKDVFVPQDPKKEYWGQQLKEFKCSFAKNCKINGEETKRTCGPGDENSNVLIIGEAPSSSGIIAEKISIPFSKIKENPKSPQYKIRDFVKKNFNNKVPYFTDYIKCGVVNQKRDRSKLKHRAGNCLDKFLIDEIAIIYPDTIIVCKSSVHKFLKENKVRIENAIGKIRNPKKISVIYLWHYSFSYNKEFKKNPVVKWTEQLEKKNKQFFLFESL